MEEDQGGEPQTPHDHFFHCLHIQHSKYENEFVENEVPEFILEMLMHKKKKRKKKGTKQHISCRFNTSTTLVISGLFLARY